MKKNKNGAGRPAREIDWKAVETALQAHCTGSEIAGYLGMHPDTFYRAVERKYGINFTNYAAAFREKGKTLLKVTQFDEAIRKRDRGMLIWLGKQLLGQKENQDAKLELSGGMAAIKIINFGSNEEPKPYDHKEEKL